LEDSSYSDKAPFRRYKNILYRQELSYSVISLSLKLFILALFLLVSLPVSSAVTVGVKPGDKVAYDITTQGDVGFIGMMGYLGLSKTVEVEVTDVSGNVVTTTVALTFQNGSGLTITSYPNDLGDDISDFWIIPAGLDKGDVVPPDMCVNETRTETWLDVQRTVCYVAMLRSIEDMSFNLTGHYDRDTGIAFLLFVGLSRGVVVLGSLTMTIKSASMISASPPPGSTQGIPGFPIESILLGIATAAVTLAILRNRKTVQR